MVNDNNTESMSQQNETKIKEQTINRRKLMQTSGVAAGILSLGKIASRTALAEQNATPDQPKERFVAPEDVETVQLDWGTMKWMSTPDVTGSEAFSAGIVILEPGKGHERHTHPNSEEILYILSGEGCQTVGDEKQKISSGNMIYIPAGIEHSTMNISWEPLRFLAIYGPPGPEAEIRNSADAKVFPPGEFPDNC